MKGGHSVHSISLQECLLDSVLIDSESPASFGQHCEAQVGWNCLPINHKIVSVHQAHTRRAQKRYHIANLAELRLATLSIFIHLPDIWRENS
jgi:hypothetical protein